MKRKIFLLLCAVTCSFTVLTACGGGSETSGQDTASSNIEISSAEIESNAQNDSDTQTQNETTLSTAFSTDGNSIWYRIDTVDSHAKILGKDSYPNEYYVFQNGELRRYYFSDETVPYSLGELSQMTDDEIIAALAASGNSDNSSELLDACNKAIANIDIISEHSEEINSKFPEFGATYSVADVKSYLEQLAEALSAGNSSSNNSVYQLAIYTDSTGNIVEKEGIACSYTIGNKVDVDLFGFNEEIEMSLAQADNTDMEINLNNYAVAIWNRLLGGKSDIPNVSTAQMDTVYIKDIIDGMNNAQVYDTYYGGYACKDGYFVTKTDENTVFVLDNLDVSNAVIDPKSENWAE